MIKKKLIGRIKAAVVSAAMIATTFITPSLTTFSNVTAATISVNKTFTTSESTAETAPNKAKIPLSGIGNASTIKLNFTTSFTGTPTIGIYGWEISEDPWWADDKQEAKPNVSGGKFSVSFTIPSRQSESEYGIQKTVLHSLSLQLKQTLPLVLPQAMTQIFQLQITPLTAAHLLIIKMVQLQFLQL